MNICNSKLHNPPSTPYSGGNNLAPFDGELYLIKQFYRLPESDQLFAALQTGSAWQEEAIFIFGNGLRFFG